MLVAPSISRVWIFLNWNRLPAVPFRPLNEPGEQDEGHFMAGVRIEWTLASKAQFDGMRKRALDVGEQDQFKEAHNEIVVALRDLAQAAEKGELLYNTRRRGGEVRHWINCFISVCYVIFREEQVGWILAYKFVPGSWPE
jgi:hypothetical protein